MKLFCVWLENVCDIIMNVECFTLMIYSEYRPDQFRQRALVKIDSNPLGNCYNLVQYKLVRPVGMHQLVGPHSDHSNEPSALLSI